MIGQYVLYEGSLFIATGVVKEEHNQSVMIEFQSFWVNTGWFDIESVHLITEDEYNNSNLTYLVRKYCD